MAIYVYPADAYGCGHYRLIWPARVLKSMGHDVRIIPPSARNGIDGEIEAATGKLRTLRFPPDAEVVVLQRVSLAQLADGIRLLRERRSPVAVVVDMDDDLRSINPANPAWAAMHKKWGNPVHTGDNAMIACQHATLVTVSTPALLRVYAPHGRGVVLPNRVPAGYLSITHDPANTAIGWPGSTHSHPDDLAQVGPAVARLLREGHTYFGVGPVEGLRQTLGLAEDPPVTGSLELGEWPYGIAKIGVGMAPLADTVFNKAKSWLKPLEMSAVGVPWVGSDRDEYRRLHVDHGAGVLATNPRTWYSALKRLATDDQWRAEKSEAGRAAAAANTVEQHAWRWLEAWDHAKHQAKQWAGQQALMI